MKVLPVLVRVNHAMAFYDDIGHYTRDALGSRVLGEINDLVSKILSKIQILSNVYFNF